MVPDNYEKFLISIMADCHSTLSEALDLDMWNNGVDTKSVYDVVDYLENRLESLDKVHYYMQVYTGQLPDIILKKHHH